MHVKHACVIWFCSFSYINIFILTERISFKVITTCIRSIIEMLDAMGFHPINFLIITFEYKISNVNITCTNLLISMDHDWFFLDYPYVVWIVWTNLCSNIYVLLLFSHRRCYKQNTRSIPCSRTCCIFFCSYIVCFKPHYL